MKIIKEERITHVPVVKFDDKDATISVDLYIILNFIDEATDSRYCFIDTIDKDDNYTGDYLFFPKSEEKELEKMLLACNVIKLAPNQSHHNDRVDTQYYKHYRYWLDFGWYDFCKKITELHNSI